ncbi:sodium/potassium-transporting ATPase subunit beta-2-like [Diaphorina citri]|uniref:Sodium/potassium-transporting ATPase subunit beta-2-like n=1 Tax=Diaphorina citri TaxID=121845 RepID=A0A3Q0IV85_DIACI|nr:sodium/potassium-transporting ATPase subunit beta-2-like [Diaphorina citri]
MPSTQKAPDANGLGYEWEYCQPKDNHTPWERFKLAIYNPSTHDVFGRSVKSWGGIFLFYVIFYSLLAIFFAICMKVLLSTLNNHYPRWQLHESIIGTNPGLGYRPMPDDPDQGALIWFKANNHTNVQKWTRKIDDFLESHNNPPSLETAVDFQEKRNNDVCTDAMIYGWEPQYYENIGELPPEMPESLKKHINDTALGDILKMQTVWVSCDGESPADREHIGPVEIYPQHGTPGYYYPYENKEGYLSPVLAVHFKNPKPNTLINVDCRAWAKNIIYKKSLVNREGSVHFEIMVD